MGVGHRQLRPVLASVGVLVAVVGWCVAEWGSPVIFDVQPPAWVWTPDGPWQPKTGLLVRLSDGVPLAWQDAGANLIQRSEPRMAPWGSLRWTGSAAEQTEILARVSRLFACVGMSVLSLSAQRLRRPLIALAGAAVVMVVIEVVAWSMGAQGQISTVLAGTVSAWSWLVLYLGIKTQLST